MLERAISRETPFWRPESAPGANVGETADPAPHRIIRLVIHALPECRKALVAAPPRPAGARSLNGRLDAPARPMQATSASRVGPTAN